MAPQEWIDKIPDTAQPYLFYFFLFWFLFGIWGILSPYIFRPVPILKIFPKKMRNWLIGKKYKPNISMIYTGSYYRINDNTIEKCEIYFVAPFNSVFPYRKMDISFSNAKLHVYQKVGFGKHEFIFDCKNPDCFNYKGLEPFEEFKPVIDFKYNEQINRLENGPNPNYEFDWKISGIEVIFDGPDPIKQIYPTIKGKRNGRKR